MFYPLIDICNGIYSSINLIIFFILVGFKSTASIHILSIVTVDVIYVLFLCH